MPFRAYSLIETRRIFNREKTLMALINCPECGQQISDRAVSCPHCGTPLQGGYCQQNAGYQQNGWQQSGYSNYAYQQQGGAQQPVRDDAFSAGPSGKSRGVAGLLALLLGGLGIHYFYLGKTTAGILMLVLTFISCGLASILALVSGIRMFIMTTPEFEDHFVYSPSTFPI